MHTLVEVNSGNSQGTHVPAFLAKLWKLVDDQPTNNLIYWSEMGNSFIIRNQAKFARDLLPLYYKHNNMASFVRQLNMYGFHKVVSVEQGGLKVDKDEMEFAHPFFLRGQESSLELIKRKIPTAKHDDSRVRPDSLQKVLMDVRHMKGKQENIDTRLLTMKRENEALWRELASLRQKHAKQTQIVSKLLQFLVGMMSSQTHRLGFKRSMPLMLSDADGPKSRKHTRNEGQALSGPVIRDVTEIFEAGDSEEDQDHSDYLTGSSGSDGDIHPKVDSPLSASAKSPYPESILGLGRESPDLLLSVDPATVNPTGNILAGRQTENNVPNDRAKAKSNKKLSSKGTAIENSNLRTATSRPTMNLQTQGQGAARQFVPIQPQPPSSTNLRQGTQINIPVASLYQTTGNEPVQFVLSIPEQNNVQTSTIGVNTDAVSITTSTATVSQPVTTNFEQAQQFTTTNSTDMVPIMRDGIVEIASAFASRLLQDPMGFTRLVKDYRNHNQTMSPQFHAKPKVSVTDDLDGHLDDMQIGLDNLKDILKSDDYKMDHSTLLGLFGDADLGNFDLNKHIQENQAAVGEGLSTSGQEMVSYNPSLFELTEDDSQFFDDSSNIFLDDELESMLTTDRTRLSKLPRDSPGTLSFSTALNGQQSRSNGSGITTPVGTSSILGAVSSPNTITQSGSTVPVTNISGAGKRKRK